MTLTPSLYMLQLQVTLFEIRDAVNIESTKTTVKRLLREIIGNEGNSVSLYSIHISIHVTLLEIKDTIDTQFNKDTCQKR